MSAGSFHVNYYLDICFKDLMVVREDMFYYNCFFLLQLSFISWFIISVFWLHITKKMFFILMMNLTKKMRMGYRLCSTCRRYIQVSSGFTSILFFLSSEITWTYYASNFRKLDEWTNFQERMNHKENEEDICNWATYRGQTLSRSGLDDDGQLSNPS